LFNATCNKEKQRKKQREKQRGQPSQQRGPQQRETTGNNAKETTRTTRTRTTRTAMTSLNIALNNADSHDFFRKKINVRRDDFAVTVMVVCLLVQLRNWKRF